MIAKGDKDVAWLDRGWQPTFLGFVPSEVAWKRQMKRMKLDHPWPTAPGHCSNYARKDMPDPDVILVNFNRERFMKATRIQRIGLVAHESVHVWQFICQNAGIEHPDMETEAYSIMSITQGIMRCFIQCWDVDVLESANDVAD